MYSYLSRSTTYLQRLIGDAQINPVRYGQETTSLCESAGEADPFVLHFPVVTIHFEERDRQLQLGCDQAARRGGDIELRERGVVLRIDQLLLRDKQLLFPDQDVEHCARAHERLLLEAGERNLRRPH